MPALPEPDAAREWLSRVGASLLIYSAIWIAFFGASIYDWHDTQTPAPPGCSCGLT